MGPQTVSIIGTPFADLADDQESLIWSQLGLGAAANRVYRALVAAVDGGVAVRREVVSLTGVSGSQVDAMLSRLSAHGLAEKVGRGRWVPLTPDVAVVAESLGIPAANLARVERFNRESIRDKVRKARLMVEHAAQRPPEHSEQGVADLATEPGESPQSRAGGILRRGVVDR